MSKFALANVTKVYSGKPGKCCCGCSGTYWRVGTSKGADKQVARICQLISNAISLDNPTLDFGSNYTAVVIPGPTGIDRLYIAYND